MYAMCCLQILKKHLLMKVVSLVMVVQHSQEVVLDEHKWVVD